MNYIVAASTDIGNTKNTNQDSYGIRVYTTVAGKIVFAVLCDGVGGLDKGEVASGTVVNAFCRWSENRLPKLCEEGIADDVIRVEWTNLIDEYNEKIKVYGKKSGVKLGTTITAMLITEKRYYIINVGDTRAYEITDNVRVLTKDQTLVEREVEAGNLTREEAKNDARRSVLLQCIGASDSIYPDMFFGETKPDAVYMLCSDGFRHEITDDEIFAYMRPEVMLSSESMKNNMDNLIDINKQRMERDNITVLSVRTFE